ncbi:MAG TPA: L-seryl-tRNA(Sec) selenium transferase, partial [Candidatus Polarisedimenticolia bacterium]|nr:L-seryl-tRNA(Sec) selenium transferase [Candidatus Polarisedimenticolia bacterium]
MARAKRSASRTPEGTPLLRALPQVDELLNGEPFRAPIAEHGRDLVAGMVRRQLSALRAEIRSGALDRRRLGERLARLGTVVAAEAALLTTSSIRPVINATGVVLHTNLGRAPLSERAVRRMSEVARSYTTLEYDLARGRRGSRSIHLDRLLGSLFPRRAAQVVNNNAAAVLLALNTLAEGREVIVSRGELVEIGGSFRIPDIMRKSGAILREVGTTNRTRLADYERAIGPRTALLMKVHPSNYRIVGFTAQVPLREVASLGRRRRVPVLMDQGSGALLDLARFGVRDEPVVGEALVAGADLVCCSGDKLLGGPQAGLLIGRPGLIRRTRENPLSRALRVDKITYAALEAALLEYLRGAAVDHLPVMRMIALSREAIQKRAERLAQAVSSQAAAEVDIAVVPGGSLLGGGSAPEETLPTALLAVRSARLSARLIEARLRNRSMPIIARIEGKRVLIDLRTVPEESDGTVEQALVESI